MPENSNTLVLNESYALNEFFDEMFAAANQPRAHYQTLLERLALLSVEDMNEKRRAADISFLYQGITFTVYNEENG